MVWFERNFSSSYCLAVIRKKNVWTPCVNKFKHLWPLRILMRYNMGVFLLRGFKKQTNKKTRTATQLCAKLASKLMWNNYFNVYLYHTYKWQRILNHCDIDGISYCRILLLTDTRTFTNATTFSVENRLLGNEKSGRGFRIEWCWHSTAKQPGIFLLNFCSLFRHELSKCAPKFFPLK